jgi:hypothetical protein
LVHRLPRSPLLEQVIGDQRLRQPELLSNLVRVPAGAPERKDFVVFHGSAPLGDFDDDSGDDDGGRLEFACKPTLCGALIGSRDARDVSRSFFGPEHPSDCAEFSGDNFVPAGTEMSLQFSGGDFGIPEYSVHDASPPDADTTERGTLKMMSSSTSIRWSVTLVLERTSKAAIAAARAGVSGMVSQPMVRGASAAIVLTVLRGRR